MIPHVLQRIHVRRPDRAYLPSPMLVASRQHFYRKLLIERAGAFVYPSFDLALRYAQILVQLGEYTMPIATSELMPDPIFAGHRCSVCGCTEMMACPTRCGWHKPAICTECVRSAPADSWVIHRPSREYPGDFLARRYIGEVPTQQTLRHSHLQGLRDQVSDGRARHACVSVPARRYGDGVRVEAWS